MRGAGTKGSGCGRSVGNRMKWGERERRGERRRSGREETGKAAEGEKKLEGNPSGSLLLNEKWVGSLFWAGPGLMDNGLGKKLKRMG